MSATNQPPRPPRPREQLPITLFEGVVLAVRGDNGLIYVGLRDLCAALGLNHIPRSVGVFFWMKPCI